MSFTINRETSPAIMPSIKSEIPESFSETDMQSLEAKKEAKKSDSVVVLKKEEQPSWGKVASAILKKAEKSCNPSDVSAFQTLISMNKDVINDKDFICDSTVFHELAKQKQPVQFVEILVKNGIDFSAKDIGLENTPLMWAIANGSNEMAQEILSRLPSSQISSLNAHSRNGNAALHLIVCKGYTTRTQSGESITCSNAELLALAIGKRADVNISDKRGNTPLHLAYVRRDVTMVKILLEHGANRDALNDEGLKPKDMIHLHSTSEESFKKATQIMNQTINKYFLLSESNYQNIENLKSLESL